MKAVSKASHTEREGFGTVRQICRDTSPAPLIGGRTLGQRPKGNKPEGTGVGSGQNGAKARSTPALAMLPTSALRRLRTPKPHPHEPEVRFYSTDPALMEEQDGMRTSAVRLRYPRRHTEATSMRRPGDPGAPAGPQGRPDWSNRCAKR